MRKILFPLFAFLLLAGCGGGGNDPLGVADMAGAYTFSKVTYTESGTTVILTSPDVSGTLTLTAAGGYTLDITIGGEQFGDTGTFSVAEPAITFVSDDGGGDSGTIANDGRTISVVGVVDGATVTMEFTRT